VNGIGGTTGGDQSLGGAAAQIKGFGPVSNDPVIAYFVDTQNNVYVVKTTGVISKITNGQSTDLSSLQIQGLLDAGFSFDGKKALVSFGDPAAPQTSVFDVT